MEAMVMWLFVVIIQVGGGSALAFSNIADCQEARTAILGQPDVVAVSECMRVELTKPHSKPI